MSRNISLLRVFSTNMPSFLALLYLDDHCSKKQLSPTPHSFFFFFLKKFTFFYLFIYLFMAVLGLRFCARALPSCGKWGPLLIAVRGPLTIAASLVAEHRLSNCGSRAQPLREIGRASCRERV